MTLRPTPSSFRNFLFIGYPKAASTYVEDVLDMCPDVSVARVTVPSLLDEPQTSTVNIKTAPPNAQARVLINEKIAESVFYEGTRSVPKQLMFTPGAWDSVRDKLRIDPLLMAQRMRSSFPEAKVLIVLRDQVDWLSSAYRYFLPRLPADKRNFEDFCSTPRGIVYLNAGFFDRTVSAYQQVFGKDNVIVSRFETLRRDPVAFSQELADHFGIASLPVARVSNMSSSVAVTRIRNRMPFFDALPPGLKSGGARILNAMSIGPGKTPILSTAQTSLLKSFYAESNTHLAALLNDA